MSLLSSLRDMDTLLLRDTRQAKRRQRCSTLVDQLPSLRTGKKTRSFAANKVAAAALLRGKAPLVRRSGARSDLDAAIEGSCTGQPTPYLQQAADCTMTHLQIHDVTPADTVALSALVSTHPALTSISLDCKVPAASAGMLRSAVQANSRIVSLSSTLSTPLISSLAETVSENARLMQKKRSTCQAKAVSRALQALRQVAVERLALAVVSESSLRESIVENQFSERKGIARQRSHAWSALRVKEIMLSARKARRAERRFLATCEQLRREEVVAVYNEGAVRLFLRNENASRLCVKMSEERELSVCCAAERFNLALATRLQRRRLAVEEGRRKALAEAEHYLRDSLLRKETTQKEALLTAACDGHGQALTEESDRIVAEQHAAKQRLNAEQQAQREAEWAEEKARIEQARLEEVKNKERIRVNSKEDEQRRVVSLKRESDLGGVQEWARASYAIVLEHEKLASAAREVVSFLNATTVEAELVLPAAATAAFYVSDEAVPVAPAVSLRTVLAGSADFRSTYHKLRGQVARCLQLTERNVALMLDAFSPQPMLKASFPSFTLPDQVACKLSFPEPDAVETFLCTATGGTVTASLLSGAEADITESFAVPKWVYGSCDVALTPRRLTIELKGGSYTPQGLTELLRAVVYTCQLRDESAVRSHKRCFRLSVVLYFNSYLDTYHCEMRAPAGAQCMRTLDTSANVLTMWPYIRVRPGTGLPLRFHEGLEPEGKPLFTSLLVSCPPTIEDTEAGAVFTSTDYIEEGCTLSLVIESPAQEDQFTFKHHAYDDEKIDILRVPGQQHIACITFGNKRILEVSGYMVPSCSSGDPKGAPDVTLRALIKIDKDVFTKVLLRIRYQNNHLRPVDELKLVCLSLTDVGGYRCEASLPLCVTGRNTPTVIEVPSPKLTYRTTCSSKVPAGLRQHLVQPCEKIMHLFSEVNINDPDTHWVLGGDVKVKIAAGATRGDNLTLVEQPPVLQTGKTCEEGVPIFHDGQLLGVLQGSLTIEKEIPIVGEPQVKQTRQARKAQVQKPLPPLETDRIELLLVLESTGTATLAGVQAFLRCVGYASNSWSASEGLRNIEIILKLGRGLPPDASREEIASTAQSGSGEYDYLLAKAELRVTAPLLDVVHQNAVDLNEGSPPTRIATFDVADVSLTGVESFGGGHIAVEIANPTAGDILGFVPREGELKVRDEELVTADGKTLGSIVRGNAKILVSFPKKTEKTATAVQRRELNSILRCFTYSKLRDRGEDGRRVVLFSLSDGGPTHTTHPVAINIARVKSVTEILHATPKLKYCPFSPAILPFQNVLPVAPQSRCALHSPDVPFFDGGYVAAEISGAVKGDTLVFMTHQQQQAVRAQYLGRGKYPRISEKGMWDGYYTVGEDKKVTDGEGLAIGDLARPDKVSLKLTLCTHSPPRIDAQLMSYVLNCIGFCSTEKVSSGLRHVLLRVHDAQVESKLKVVIDMQKPILHVTVDLRPKLQLLREGVALLDRPTLTIPEPSKDRQFFLGYVDITLEEGAGHYLFYRDVQRVHVAGDQILLGSELLGEITISSKDKVRIEFTAACKATGKTTYAVLQLLFIAVGADAKAEVGDALVRVEMGEQGGEPAVHMVTVRAS